MGEVYGWGSKVVFFTSVVTKRLSVYAQQLYSVVYAEPVQVVGVTSSGPNSGSSYK